MELTELCAEIRNWFERDRIIGEFTISGGSISVPEGFLQENQYYRIIGSVFNDGVHQHSASDLIDETFDGAVVSMAVPPAVMDLLSDITEWESKYGNALLSPYSSESFGGYSYSKSVGTGGSGADSVSYRTIFANRLNKWRKI